jgi:hypothetical protein
VLLLLLAWYVVCIGSAILENNGSLTCGSIVLQSEPSLAFTGGHYGQCFTEKPITYEYCRMLLYSSNNCSALSYSRGNCWLHDISQKDFSQVTVKSQYNDNIGTISILKLIDKQQLANCQQRNNGVMMLYTDTSSALYRFEQCTLKSTIDDAVYDLPLLALVISVTNHWAIQHETELTAVTANMKCYCKFHGYTFVSMNVYYINS